MPDGWEYIRLYNIGDLGSGFTPKPHELATSGIIPYFKVADMNNEGNEKYLVNTQNYLISRPKKVFPKNSIAFPKNGGAVFTNKKRVLVISNEMSEDSLLLNVLILILLIYCFQQ